MRPFFFLLLFSFFLQNAISQSDTIISIEEVTITQDRIFLPYKSQNRQVQVLTKNQIKELPAQTIPEILQFLGGMDIRRRGISGVQSDVSIRGGSFEQVLILLNGIRMNDPQTGHHSMYVPINPDDIERIEIVKGGAARIFGQNAYSGVINIVTKTDQKTNITGNFQYGSFHSSMASAHVGMMVGSTSHNLSTSLQQSDGYRYNTDYKIRNIFYQSKFKISDQPIDFFGGFTDRKFGANGFYANEKYKDQYEEIQTSIIGLTSRFIINDKWSLKPVFSWRRNQDEYVFIRDNPNYYRNVHINNAVNASLHSTSENDLGQLGLGVEYTSHTLRSNNLGDQNRNIFGFFAEQSIITPNEKWTITTGFYTQYIDQIKKWNLFPGLDVSYGVNKEIKLFMSSGINNRIPSYTDLYYKSSVEEGNHLLLPEQSYDIQVGSKMTFGNLINEVSIFHKHSNNTIEWIKDSINQIKWQATNLTKIRTSGIEWRSDLAVTPQVRFGVKYCYLYQDARALNNSIGRYSLDQLAHQVVGSYIHRLGSTKLTLGVFGRYNVRNVPISLVNEFGDGKVFLLDSDLSYKNGPFKFRMVLNNLTNESYRETSLVPMPGRSFNLEVAYKWDI